MRTSLLTLFLSIGLLGISTAKAFPVCFTDIYGYIYSLDAVKTGPGYIELNGTATALSDWDWNVTGYIDKTTNTVFLSITNLFPDGCTLYVTGYDNTGTFMGGGSIEGTWTNFCGDLPWATGFFSGTIAKGDCAEVGKATVVGPQGPASVDGVTRNITVLNEGLTLEELFGSDELNVTRNGNQFVFYCTTTELDDAELVIYNHAGQQVRTIINSGGNTITWNGLAADGTEVMSGMYVAVIHREDERMLVKFIK